MPIDTINQDIPIFTLPVYIKISEENRNDYKVGEVYKVREGRDVEYTFKSTLISKETKEMSELTEVEMAFAGCSTDERVVLERAIPFDYEEDKEVIVLTFIRHDKALDFIENNNYDPTDIDITDLTIKDKGEI